MHQVIRQHFQNAKQNNQGASEELLDNIKDELVYEIKVSSNNIKLNNQAEFFQDIKASLSGLSSKDGIDLKLDEEECHSCDSDSLDDFDLWKYCLKLGPEWHSEVPIHLHYISLHYSYLLLYPGA